MGGISVSTSGDLELEESLLNDLEDVASAHHDRYIDQGYRLTDVRLNNLDRDSSGTYKGRTGLTLGTAHIRLNTDSRKEMEATLAHELGHDAFKYFLRGIGNPVSKTGDDLLLYRTFNELYANLNARQLRDDLGEDWEIQYRDPFRSIDRAQWKRLEQSLDQDRREQERELLQELHSDLKEQAYTQARETAADLAAIQPAPTGGNDMFLDLLDMDRIARDKHRMHHVLETIDALDSDTVSWSQVGEQVLTAYQEGKDCEHDSLQQDIYETVRDLERQDLLHDSDLGTVKDLLTGRYDSEDERERLASQRPDRVLTSLLEDYYNSLAQHIETLHDQINDQDEYDLFYSIMKDRDYGYRRQGSETDYDTYIDLPHSVGGELAAALYSDGHTVDDILDQPDQYYDLVEHAIEYTFHTWMDGPKNHSRDRMLQYLDPPQPSEKQGDQT